jgi:hypothetical protein
LWNAGATLKAVLLFVVPHSANTATKFTTDPAFTHGLLQQLRKLDVILVFFE